MSRALTLTQAADLPTVLDVQTAGRLLGIGRTTAYRLVRDGQFPTRVLPVGRTWRVPTADLLTLLGLNHTPDGLSTPPVRPALTAVSPTHLLKT